MSGSDAGDEFNDDLEVPPFPSPLSTIDVNC